MNSKSFDRVADHYEATRQYPATVSDRITDSLISLLAPNSMILEIGIGTGRIARPLLIRGISIFGVDLSMKMMKQLLANLPSSRTHPPLTVGNAINLPFATNCFNAAIAVHVLHLIPDWEQALQEILRILKPGGAFFVGFDWRSPDSPPAQMRDQWSKIKRSITDNLEHPLIRDFKLLKTALDGTGATIDEWEAAQWEASFNPSKYLQQLAEGCYSNTWEIPAEKLSQCLRELHLWAIDEFGTLDQEFTVTRKFIWYRFRWN